MQIAYRASTPDGKIVKGFLEAKDTKEAATFLRGRELMPLTLAAKQESLTLSVLSFFTKPNEGDVVFFTRQLSSMLASGLTIMQTLHILKSQIQKESMATIVNEIITDIESGKSFSQSIAKYPEIFSPIYISLAKAAETSGLMDKVMLRLADNLEKRQQLKATVKSALLYPLIVIIGMVIVVFIMMIFVIPQLATLYESLNVELPLPTLIVIGVSRFFTVYWPIAFGSIALLFFGFRRWHKTDVGKLTIDKYSLRLPVFGVLFRNIIMTEFSRTLGLLIGSGALVVEGLRQTSDIAGNELYKNAILQIAQRVEKGVSVGTAMQASPLFPPIIVQMSKIGEETGKLDDSLLRVSEYFQREVDQRVKTLTTAMEPIIMLMLGIGVAFLIISIISPIYNLTNAIK